MENTKDKWRIELLGVRGSMTMTPGEYREYGCDTVCVQITTPSKVLFLYAGSGIMYGKAGAENHLLIGHPHLDHLLGLCKWTELADPAKKMKIYMAEHGGRGCEEILNTLYGPPFWPIHLHEVSKDLEYVTIQGDFELGEIQVKTLAGNHPGGVTHFKITDGERTIVYAVDCELTSESKKELMDFARDCDILFCDGQFLEEEAPERRGWGHSSMTEAAEFGTACGAKQTVILHFDPSSTDAVLRKEEEKIRRSNDRCVFGRQGEIRYL